MPTTMLTRKPVNALTAQDLEEFRVWRYATDEEHTPGQDETWVRPVGNKNVGKGVYSQIAAANFTTPTGRSLSGFMLVTTAAREPEIRPGAVLAPRYLVLPAVPRETAMREGYEWSLRDRNSLVQSLGATEADTFPLHYKLRVLISGEKSVREGSIP